MSTCCDVQHPIPSANHARYECLRVKRPTRRGDNTNSLPQDHTASFYACKSSWGILMPTHLHSLTSAVMNPHRLLDGHVQYGSFGPTVVTNTGTAASNQQGERTWSNAYRASVRTKYQAQRACKATGIIDGSRCASFVIFAQANLS